MCYSITLGIRKALCLLVACTSIVLCLGAEVLFERIQQRIHLGLHFRRPEPPAQPMSLFGSEPFQFLVEAPRLHSCAVLPVRPAEIAATVAQLDEPQTPPKDPRPGHSPQVGNAIDAEAAERIPPETLELIRRLRRKPRGGERLSYDAIAVRLNEMGIPSRSGGRWLGPTVCGICKRSER